MKMETEVRAAHSGTIAEVLVAEGDSVATGDALIALAQETEDGWCFKPLACDRYC